ncbi:hypothetical protein RJ639_043143 [Escallonia herrerae]|uniref:F-box domain-containing protein n=1 Tax=Escallonia herrerae TaxID=1293975 RepID=A0AA88WAX5_9ASTE|nr:hypothetical protein RJ639_043143 [Escallonia herrerae]
MDRRMIPRNNTYVPQVLIEWSNMNEEDATWEDWTVMQHRGFHNFGEKEEARIKGAMEDIISSMPQDILFIIVRLLPFKEAVKTSILSRNWRFIWLATRNIDLDERHFVKQDEESEEHKEHQRRDLIRFTRRWIERYEEPVIHKFRLAFSYPENHALDLQDCIRLAVARGVKVLDLDFSVPSWNEMSLEDHHEALFDLPLTVYEDHDENLESLKLFSCDFLVARFRNFRALKNLSLDWVDLKSYVVTALLSNCTVLESLSLKRCWDLSNLDISAAPSLTSLVVDKCFDLERGIRVDVRTLRFFKYSGRVISPLRIEGFRYVVEAVLDFGLEFQFSDCRQILHDFLFTLCRVRALTICSYMLQGYNIDLPLQNHNFVLRELDDGVPPCVALTLKVVEVKGFKGGNNELLALQYFIRHGNALEKMVISVSKEEGPAGVFGLGLRYRQKAMRLLQVQRASGSLAIVIS